MRNLSFFFLLALFLAGVFGVAGDEFWENKDYRQWSKQECERLLSDSPWSKTVGQYHAQLRSALPIRQAIVRLMQIEQVYDSLSPEQRLAFDQRADQGLQAYSSDTIIVDLSGAISVYGLKPAIERLRNVVFLVPSKSPKVPLLRYEMITSGVTGTEHRFIFPRQQNGRPVLSARDKSLSLEFEYPERQHLVHPNPTDNMQRALIEFKLSKMQINGEVMY